MLLGLRLDDFFHALFGDHVFEVAGRFVARVQTGSNIVVEHGEAVSGLLETSGRRYPGDVDAGHVPRGRRGPIFRPAIPEAAEAVNEKP